MARSALLKRLDRLEQTAEGECIVYEAGDDIPEEERERFLKEEVGEISPNSLVVWVRRFGVPDLPPRLLHRWPVSVRWKGSGRATGANPVGLQHRRAAPVPARLLDEDIIPKHDPALSYRARDIDIDDDDF
jgi:hypothetical protein